MRIKGVKRFRDPDTKRFLTTRQVGARNRVRIGRVQKIAPGRYRNMDTGLELSVGQAKRWSLEVRVPRIKLEQRHEFASDTIAGSLRALYVEKFPDRPITVQLERDFIRKADDIVKRNLARFKEWVDAGAVGDPPFWVYPKNVWRGGPVVQFD